MSTLKSILIFIGAMAIITIGYFSISNKENPTKEIQEKPEWVTEDNATLSEKTQDAENKNNNIIKIDWVDTTTLYREGPELEHENTFYTYDLYLLGEIENTIYKGKLLTAFGRNEFGRNLAFLVCEKNQSKEESCENINIWRKGIDKFVEETESEKNNYFIIEDIENLEENIYIEKYGATFSVVDRYSYVFLTNLLDEYKLEKVTTNDELENIYFWDKYNCFIKETPDHRALGYSYWPPFIDNDTGEIEMYLLEGGSIKTSYSYLQRNNNSVCNAYFYDTKSSNDVEFKEKLSLAGVTNTGDYLYMISDTEDSYLKDVYNNMNSPAYTTTPSGIKTAKYTYAQFISFFPVLYWQDPFGNWVEFRNEEFVEYLPNKS